MPWDWEGYGVVDHSVRELRWSGSKISDYAQEIAESGGASNDEWGGERSVATNPPGRSLYHCKQLRTEVMS